MGHTKTRIKICSIVSLFLAASLTISSLSGLTVFAVGPGNYDHETSIISGSGGTHIIGSGQDLSFVFEETLERFYGEGLLFVDDNSIDITEDALINSRTKTITLLSRYLDTLPSGNHHLEVLFPDEEQGFAQADFTIVESESGPVVPVDPITATYPYYAFVEDENNPWSSVYDALDTTDTIEYSDSYFEVASPGDHPELRAVSYALALAGFENEADGYPSNGSTPNLKLHTFMNQLGFSNYYKMDTSSFADGDSFGTTIARKTLPSGQTLIVVAPRNYNYMTEWLSNFNVGTSGDHAGFTMAAESVKERLDEYIYVNHLTDYKIWMVGYSRGGAVIDLAAKMVNENLSDYDMAPDDFYVYTFGAPRASLTEPGYTNIHDVKDGNDLLLGYVFPELWGFYNTGTYEEIHPSDLTIPAAVVNISDLADPTRAFSVLADNTGLTEQVATINGRDFMDSWIQFVTENGLTREYFDTEVKGPLSEIMKLYQTRTLDKQSDFTDFISNISEGLAGMVAGNAFEDLMTNYNTDLSTFPAYLDLVKVMKGTASDAEVNELITILTGYMGEYGDYETKLGKVPAISETEFSSLKENLPKLVKALIPLLQADARYTQETYGENYSLYYTYTLASNAEKLVIGHIPESIMPILKSLLPHIPVPNTGIFSKDGLSLKENCSLVAVVTLAGVVVVASATIKLAARKRFLTSTKK